MAELGERLIDNGYSVLPIIPSAKSPGRWQESRGWVGLTGWERFCDRAPKSFELDIWQRWPGCGIGIPCGFIHGVDIDVLDEAAATAIERLARAELGDTPCLRIGLAPKRLLVYRSAVSFPSIKKHPIEVLGHGAQFVGYGIHGETGNPYFWPHEGLDEVHIGRLPEITEEQCRRFLDLAYEMVPPELRQRKLGPDRSADYYYAGGELRGTRAAVAAAMEFIPNGDLDYDSWIYLGLAIKGALGADGFDIFAGWSAQSSKHGKSGKKDTPAKVWRGLKPERLGAGTIYYYAGQNGWVPDSSLILNGALESAQANGAGQELFEALTAKIPPHDPETGEIFEDEVAAEPTIERDTGGEVDDIIAGAGGLLGDLVRWMTATARFPQPLLSLGASLTMCGALMGHRYRLLNGPDTRSNVMVLGLAGSGSGKDHPRRCVIKALSHAGLDRFYHGRSIASAQGIIGTLSSFYSGVMLLDEAGLFFANMMDQRAPSHMRAVGALLMELSTSASSIFYDAVKAADRDPDAVRYDIPDPCFNLFATTVPEPFWQALNSGSADSGFLARFLMFETPVNYPDPQFDIHPIEKGLDGIAAQMRQIVSGPGVKASDFSIAASLGQLQPRWDKNGDKRVRLISSPEVPAVPMSTDAISADREIAIDEVNQKRANEGRTQATSIIARTTEHVRRLALIRAVSRDPFAPTVEVEDMRWAHAVVRMSQGLMIPAIAENIADTPWEATLKKLLRIIRKHGDWMDMSMLSDRCYFLKSKERNEGIIQLLESGKLESRKEGTATKPRTFVRVARGCP